MKKLFFTLLIVTASLAVSVKFSQASGTAVFSIEPTGMNVKTGEVFTEDVYINPNGESVDTLRVNMQYPSDMVELQNAAKDSAFSFTSGGNVLNNTEGYFSYGAGVPGGVTARTRYLTLKFKALKSGQAVITIKADSLALASADNKLSGQEQYATIKISGATVVAGVERYLDGELIRGKNGRVYVIVNNKRVLIKTPAQLKSFAGQKINNVDDLTLNSYPESTDQFRVNNYKNGTLLRANGDKDVYVLYNGGKKKISSPTELKKYGKSKIINVDKKVLNSYPYYVPDSLKNKDNGGNLMRDTSTKKIYLIANGKKKYIASISELKKYSSKTIINVSSKVLISYPLAK